MIVFTIRLEKDLAKSLADLAKRTHRSKASVIRWLISEASREMSNGPVVEHLDGGNRIGSGK